MNTYMRHGLTGNTKRRVFEALYQRQQGKCFLCGISQDKLPRKLQIDHCHATGMIRGLLCEVCNSHLGMAERYGIFQYFYRSASLDIYPRDMGWLLIFLDTWLITYRKSILLYMQKDTWLPREGILIHLQSEVGV